MQQFRQFSANVLGGFADVADLHGVKHVQGCLNVPLRLLPVAHISIRIKHTQFLNKTLIQIRRVRISINLLYHPFLGLSIGLTTLFAGLGGFGKTDVLVRGVFVLNGVFRCPFQALYVAAEPVSNRMIRIRLTHNVHQRLFLCFA